MIGQRNRGQLEFLVCGSIRDLLPDDHVLVRIEAVLDLSWLRRQLEALYADGFGRPGVEPEAALRLMLAGFLLGLVQDRKLMRVRALPPPVRGDARKQVILAIRWIAGFDLTERLPDHSSLTRIRQRWVEELFRTVSNRVVQKCPHKGLVAGDVVHVDASLIRANDRPPLTQRLGAVANVDALIGLEPKAPSMAHYQKILREHGFPVSMSGKGNCYDRTMGAIGSSPMARAAVETFFKTIKAELIW